MITWNKRDSNLTQLLWKIGLIESVKAARKRCDIHLEERRSAKKEGYRSKQKQILQCETDQLKLAKNSLQDLCKSFDEEFVKLLEEAEEKDFNMNIKCPQTENKGERQRNRWYEQSCCYYRTKEAKVKLNLTGWSP